MPGGKPVMSLPGERPRFWGYVAKEKHGRRNVYHIQAHLPLHDSNGERAIGELLSLFADTEPGKE
jgi:hypothetical protein